MEGIDDGKVGAWLEANIVGAEGPFRFELIAGGRSNLTFKVTGADRQQYVLRRPPISHVLPTAHDMGREFRVIAALEQTPVPVAPALALCTDETVNERPFYVMGYVDGHVLRDRSTGETVLDEKGRTTAGEHVVDVLADIHAVDIDDVGLGELGRREGYVERQLKRWFDQYHRSIAGRDRSPSSLDDVHDLLSSRIPPQGPGTIVHGDYKLNNIIVDDGGQVRAVLDWELCTLGDPLADLGYLMVFWEEGEESVHAPGTKPLTALPGYPTRDELAKRYAARTGRDVSVLPFYIAFGYWRVACIVEGVSARYEAGAMGGDRSNLDGFAVRISALTQAARDAATSL
jgi:aminoglycoside phosphotransferase (APT) family kinase protein